MSNNEDSILFQTKERSTEVLLRRANATDVNLIVLLSRATDRFSLSEETNEPDAEEMLFWIKDPRSIVLVADQLCPVKRPVVGYAYGTCVSPKWFAFEAFQVTENLQRCGIGKAMYSLLRQLCAEIGVSLIQGLVIDGPGNSLPYWIERGFEEGKKCIWVEDWLE